MLVKYNGKYFEITSIDATITTKVSGKEKKAVDIFKKMLRKANKL